MAFFLLVVCWMSFADKTVRKAVASAENIKTFEAANNTRGLSSHMKVLCTWPFHIITKIFWVAKVYINSQDRCPKKANVVLHPTLITLVMEIPQMCITRIKNEYPLFFFKTHSAFCIRKQRQVQWVVTVLLVPGFQRSQTRSKDLKNKENPVTENILLHSSFESLPLKVLRTNYFQYELAPGERIKGAFLFQLVMKRALQKTLVTWMAVLRFPETQWAFLIQGTKRQRCVTDLNECGSWVDSTHSSAL